VGNAGSISLHWLLLPAVAVLSFSAMARLEKRELSLLLLSLLLVQAGMLAGFRDASRLEGRRGRHENVSLQGRIEVGSRGSSSGEALLLRVERVLSGSLARPAERYLLLPESAEGPALRWGDLVEAEGLLRIYGSSSGGIAGCFRAERVEIRGSSAGPLLRLALAFRDRVEEVTSALPADEASLVRGMLLGDYRRLGERELLSLRASGLIHICAASGLHVGILTAALLWSLRRLSLSRRAAHLLALPVLLVYALATGLSVPVQRAGLVVAAAALSLFLGRDFDFLAAAGAAMFFLFLRDSNLAASTSFQLSFAAALGVALFSRPLASPWGTGGSRAALLLATSLAAQLAVAPVLLTSFGEISLLAPLSNMLVLPVLPLLMGASLLSALLAWLGVPAARLPLALASPAARWVLAVARFTAEQRWALLRLFPLRPGWTLAYYAALLAAFLAVGKTRKWGRRALVLLVALALLGGLQFHLPLHASPGKARVTFFDVGQGDAALFQAGSGATVLVDGGKDERRLEEELRARDIRYIDVVAVSHPEEDHVGGLEAALEVCGVGLILHPPLAGDEMNDAFFARAEEMGVPMREMSEGMALQVGEVTLRALAPRSRPGEETPLNDRSLVLRITAPGLEVLMAGDIEETGQENLMREGDLACGVLKVPHHGSARSSGLDFLRAVAPRLAVISCAASNHFGFPARPALERYQALRIPLARTHALGAVVGRLSASGELRWSALSTLVP
jgi:competence protein ComEC